VIDHPVEEMVATDEESVAVICRVEMAVP